MFEFPNASGMLVAFENINMRNTFLFPFEDI